MEKNFSWKIVTENSAAPGVDFSVNTNALGLPRTVRQMADWADAAGRYPDPDCRALRRSLAEKYGIDPSRILCGNGADDLLYRLVLALQPRRALVIEPTFEEYSRALSLVDCEVKHHLLKEETAFAPDETILSAIGSDCDMVFFCNPNNPTGQLVNSQLLLRILQRCREEEVLLVVDESFMEFLLDWQNHTMKKVAATDDDLIVIDALTKTYALAGFRLGFCVSGNEELLHRMRRCGQEYGVSVPAQLAGLCALAEDAYLKQTHRQLPTEREWMRLQLQTLPMKVYPSRGNFLLCKTPQPDIVERLARQGVRVRDCSRFYGLDSHYCRIAVRTREENLQLLEAFRFVLENQ